jgi:hypothetical protein
MSSLKVIPIEMRTKEERVLKRLILCSQQSTEVKKEERVGVLLYIRHRHFL